MASLSLERADVRCASEYQAKGWQLQRGAWRPPGIRWSAVVADEDGVARSTR